MNYLVDFINFGFTIGILTYFMGLANAVIVIAILTVFYFTTGLCYEWSQLT